MNGIPCSQRRTPRQILLRTMVCLNDAHSSPLSILEVMRQSSRQCDNQQRWIRMPTCREHRAAGDIQVSQTMHLAIGIHDSVTW